MQVGLKVDATNVKEVIAKVDAAAKPNFELLRDLCRYLTRNDPDIALKYLKQGMEMATAAKDDSQIASMHIQFGNLNLLKNKHTKAKEYYESSIKYFAEDASDLGTAYNNLAGIAFDQQNEEDCFTFLKKAYEIRLKTNSKEKAYFILTNLATCYYVFGYHEKAIAAFLNVLNKHDINEKNNKKLFSVAYSGLAGAYNDMGENQKAATFMEKALNISKQLNQPLQLAIDLARNALYQFRVGNLKKATLNNDEAIELFLAINNKERLAMAFHFKGNIEAAKENYKEAIQFINRAIETHEKSENIVPLSSMYIDGGLIYLKTNQLESAKTCGQKVIKLLEGKNEGNLIAHGHELLYKVYKAQKKNGKALHHLEAEKKIMAELITAEKNKNIVEMEAKYEKAKGEQEAQQLKLDKLTFQQKALRAQMNPHFIFNSLNSIQRFIAAKDHNAASIFVTSFSKLMRQILENSDEEFNALDDVIIFLNEYLSLEQMRFNNKFTFQIKVDDEIEEDLIKIPSMIVQPYVENAIIHGVNAIKDGHIVLEFTLFNEHTILCTIADNGKGIEHVKMMEKKTNHQSMGTRITKERIIALAAKYNRKVKIESVDLSKRGGRGTEVKIYLPTL